MSAAPATTSGPPTSRALAPGGEAQAAWLEQLAAEPALEHGAVERLDDGSFRVAGEVLAPEEVIQGERHELPGWATAEDEGISVAFDDELRTEGRREDRFAPTGQFAVDLRPFEDVSQRRRVMSGGRPRVEREAAMTFLSAAPATQPSAPDAR